MQHRAERAHHEIIDLTRKCSVIEDELVSCSLEMVSWEEAIWMVEDAVGMAMLEIWICDRFEATAYIRPCVKKEPL